MGKSKGNWHCGPPLPILLFWESCLPIMLDCPPVQSFYNTTANFRVHASVIFHVNSGERPLLMVYFLKCLETSPFCWRGFCRCAINRLGHAFCRTWNVFTNGALIPSIRLAASQKLWRNFCFMSFVHAQSTSESKLELFVFRVCATRLKCDFAKFQHKSTSYSQEKSKRQSLLLFFMNDRIQNFWDAICISRTHYWFSRTNMVEP